jgi:hypothetical protein
MNKNTLEEIRRLARHRDKKNALQQMRELAAARGGKCLSTTYTSNRAKLLWQCREGHAWEATPGHISRGQWCPTCKGLKKRNTIEQMQQLAASRGGKCLSATYTSNRAKLLWQCSEGHQWEASPDVTANRGQWCSTCARMQRRTRNIPKRIHQLAAKRGGKCLSVLYRNITSKLLWQCKEGHQWETTPEIIRRGSWCPTCSGKAKKTIEQMQAHAATRGGTCLSTTYRDAHAKLLWQCREGHQWETTPNHIRRGHWCPTCAKAKQKTKAKKP